MFSIAAQRVMIAIGEAAARAASASRFTSASERTWIARIVLWSLSTAWDAIDGVLGVNVNYATQQMRVEFDKQKTDQAAIEKRVRSLCDTTFDSRATPKPIRKTAN